jgi:ABC-2 type transport system permease protein
LSTFLRKTWAFMVRDLKTALSYPLAFLLGVGGIFFNVVMLYFLSRYMPRPNYFPFVIVGLAMQNYLAVAMGGLTRSIRESQMLGTLEMLLSSPTSLPVIIFASSIGPFLVTTLRIAVFFLFAMILGESFHCASPAAVAVVVVLSITSFSVFGVLSAAVILVLKRGNPFNLLVAASSTLLAGIFYPVHILPDWLQLAAWFLPVTHAVEAMRRLVLSGGGFGDIREQLLWLFLFSAIALPGALAAFAVGVRRARREGTLAHY